MEKESHSPHIKVVLFSSHLQEQGLEPLTLTRPAFTFRMGMWTLAEVLTQELKKWDLFSGLAALPYVRDASGIRDRLLEASLACSGLPLLLANASESDEECAGYLYICGQLVPDVHKIRTLLAAVASEVKRALVENMPLRDLHLWGDADFGNYWEDGVPVLCLTKKHFASFTALQAGSEEAWLRHKKNILTEKFAPKLSISKNDVIQNFYEWLDVHEKQLSTHLRLYLAEGPSQKAIHLVELQPHVWAEKEKGGEKERGGNNCTKITYANIAFHASAENPIILGAGVRLGDYSVLTGPLYLGAGSVVAPHSSIAMTATGREVSLGGEVMASIFHDYTNKKHFGFIGHSVIGSWVNLGAGTTTSNLKNTYQPMVLRGKDGHLVETKRLFMGAFIGDYVKSAIHMSIYGGSCIGPGANVIAPVTKGLAPLTNSRTGKRLEVAAVQETHVAMFARRKKIFSEGEKKLLQLLDEYCNEQALA